MVTAEVVECVDRVGVVEVEGEAVISLGSTEAIHTT